MNNRLITSTAARRQCLFGTVVDQFVYFRRVSGICLNFGQFLGVVKLRTLSTIFFARIRI